MKHTLTSLCIFLSLGLTACATPVGQVQKWSISGAEAAELSGEVVDVLCQLSGNCVDQCGAGTRQLAIKTEQTTVLIAKDLNFYTGAAQELWPYCNQQLVVNGQFTQTGNTRFFQIQNVRTPTGPWMTTSKFLENWAAKNGESLSKAKDWYRHDQRVNEILEQDGRLGLGREADNAYFK